MERESAQLLMTIGAAPADVAAQLARSAEVGDVAAVAALREAADALSATDPPAAADLGVRALALVPPVHDLYPQVAAKTAKRLFYAGRGDQAREIASATVAATEMPPEAEAWIRKELANAAP